MKFVSGGLAKGLAAAKDAGELTVSQGESAGRILGSIKRLTDGMPEDQRLRRVTHAQRVKAHETQVAQRDELRRIFPGQIPPETGRPVEREIDPEALLDKLVRARPARLERIVSQGISKERANLHLDMQENDVKSGKLRGFVVDPSQIQEGVGAVFASGDTGLDSILVSSDFSQDPATVGDIVLHEVEHDAIEARPGIAELPIYETHSDFPSTAHYEAIQGSQAEYRKWGVASRMAVLQSVADEGIQVAPEVVESVARQMDASRVVMAQKFGWAKGLGLVQTVVGKTSAERRFIRKVNKIYGDLGSDWRENKAVTKILNK